MSVPTYTFRYSTSLPVSSTKRHAYIIEVSTGKKKKKKVVREGEEGRERWRNLTRKTDGRQTGVRDDRQRGKKRAHAAQVAPRTAATAASAERRTGACAAASRRKKIEFPATHSPRLASPRPCLRRCSLSSLALHCRPLPLPSPSSSSSSSSSSFPLPSSFRSSPLPLPSPSSFLLPPPSSSRLPFFIFSLPRLSRSCLACPMRRLAATCSSF